MLKHALPVHYSLIHLNIILPLQARDTIADLDTQLEETVKKTTRKINTIKAQFQEHKARWEEVSSTMGTVLVKATFKSDVVP